MTRTGRCNGRISASRGLLLWQYHNCGEKLASQLILMPPLEAKKKGEIVETSDSSRCGRNSHIGRAEEDLPRLAVELRRFCHVPNMATTSSIPSGQAMLDFPSRHGLDRFGWLDRSGWLTDLTGGQIWPAD